MILNGLRLRTNVTYFSLSLSLSLLYLPHSKRMHAIAMVEKGTTQENLAFRDGGTVRSHPMLAPMTSTSSITHLIDDDRYVDAGSVQ